MTAPSCPPILLLVFNRPDLAARVFAAIREARPRRLFIAADGPRPGVAGEEALCQASRALAGQVDWPCEVLTLYRTSNLGCRNAVGTAIDWFFSHVEEGIVLEDDCLPHPSFFRYCAECLDRYRQDPRVMAVTGDNFQAPGSYRDDTYYFSIFNHVWGWASWRRAWNTFDIQMKSWPATRLTPWLESLLGSRSAAEAWRDAFDVVHAGELDTWDRQWTYACWAHGGLTATPGVNLITNIGFGERGTHTKNPDDPYAAVPSRPLRFPLRHPEQVEANVRADRYVLEEHFGMVRGRRIGLSRLPLATLRKAAARVRRAVRSLAGGAKT